MENVDFNWLDSDYALTYKTPEPLTSSSLGVNAAASPATERLDQPSGERVLPLLRLSGWESNKQYDKDNLIYRV